MPSKRTALRVEDSIDALIARLGLVRGAAAEGASAYAGEIPLSLGWPELDAVLPDGGLPRGVVELAAPRALGGSTSVALAAVRAAHAGDARAWCAWIDPEASLYGPGVAMAGVDLARLFVVRPPRETLARVAVKVASSGAFDVVAVDIDPVPGATGEGVRGRRQLAPEVFVRKLALAAEQGGATILLLTDSTTPRAVPWPVALRLELSRTSARELAIRVAKDRRGRVGLKKTIPFGTRPLRASVGG